MSRKITNRETDSKLSELWYNTQLTYDQMSKELNLTYKQVIKDVHRLFTPEQIRERKVKNYCLSKTGPKNPMFGKFFKEHPNYKGRVRDGKGYYIILKPDWFTGRPGSKHIYEHHANFCLASGLTEIPEGFSVHHVDGDKENNDPNNLALLTKGGHSRLHGIEKGWNVGKCNDHPERE